MTSTIFVGIAEVTRLAQVFKPALDMAWSRPSSRSPLTQAQSRSERRFIDRNNITQQRRLVS